MTSSSEERREQRSEVSTMSNEYTRESRLADGIGRALREARISAGLSNKELAGRMAGKHAPRVSNIENGKAEPNENDIDQWGEAVGLSAAETQRLHGILAEFKAWEADLKVRIRYGVAGHELDYTGTYKSSKVISAFATAEIPSFLQTADYARASIALSAPDAAEDERDEAVDARLTRGKYLDGRREFNVVIAEPALRWLICDPDAMRAQLTTLYEVLKTSGVDLRILPMNHRLPVIPWQGFTLHDSQFVVVDLYGGATRFRQQEARRYAAIMKALLGVAVGGDDARRLLDAAVKSLPKR
jgi:transcriptional regulator with XRE-family HTH domain